MRVAVSGSIANDYLMTFPGRFSEQIVPDAIEDLSLSFLIDALEIRRGGVAANICYGLGLLGLAPVLVGSVGRDFRDSYGPHLDAAGVDTSLVRTSDDAHTAMFLCTTDTAESQIASFYPGAMAESAQIDLPQLLATGAAPDLVVVAPNDPEAMVRHTRETLEQGWALAADPSQQLPRLDGDTVRTLIDGAAYLFSNAYEAALIESKSGWSSDEILDRVGLRVTTHGAKGCEITGRGVDTVHVPAVPPRDGAPLEPTGVGDAFRAGFIAGAGAGHPLERSAQLGALIATHTLETTGPQEWTIDAAVALDRLGAAYDDAAAADLEPIIKQLATHGG